MTLQANAQYLNENLSKLKPNDVKFAASLLTAYAKRGNAISDSQKTWIAKMADRCILILAPKVEQPKHLSFREVGADLCGVIALFDTAKKHLKFPKITIELDGETFVMSPAGPHSKTPGAINVTSKGDFHTRTWFGRITITGDWEPSQSFKANAHRESLTLLLLDLAIDPATVAQKLGKLSGNCCFCSKALTDARSTNAGYGPICAEHYGLKAQWDAAAGA